MFWFFPMFFLKCHEDVHWSSTGQPGTNNKKCKRDVLWDFNVVEISFHVKLQNLTERAWLAHVWILQHCCVHTVWPHLRWGECFHVSLHCWFSDHERPHETRTNLLKLLHLLIDKSCKFLKKGHLLHHKRNITHHSQVIIIRLLGKTPSLPRLSVWLERHKEMCWVCLTTWSQANSVLAVASSTFVWRQRNVQTSKRTPQRSTGTVMGNESQRSE